MDALGMEPPVDPAMVDEQGGALGAPVEPELGMDPGMDPMGAPGGMGAPADPAAAMGGMFPTLDQNTISQVLGTLLQAQEMDAAAFKQKQIETMVTNPLFAAITGQAPAPGAGMDAGALGADPGMLPEPTDAEMAGGMLDGGAA